MKMTSQMMWLTLGYVFLSCYCRLGVLSYSAGPPDSVCADINQTPSHGPAAQTSTSPYQVVRVGHSTIYDSSDRTPIQGTYVRTYVHRVAAVHSGTRVAHGRHQEISRKGHNFHNCRKFREFSTV